MISRRSTIIGAGAAFLTRPALAMPGLLKPMSPLAFPQGRIAALPSTDHPLFKALGGAAKVIFSGVATGNGGGIRRIDTGGVQITNGTPLTQMDLYMGPCFQTNDSASNYMHFTGVTSISTTYFSAGIFTVTPYVASGVSQLFVYTDGTHTSGLWGESASNVWSLGTVVNSGSYNAGYSNLTIGDPLFVVLYISGTNSFSIVKNLRTGSAQASQGTTTAPVISGSTMSVYVGGQAGYQRVAAVFMAISNSAASAGSILGYVQQAALDPWSLWYPETQLNVMSAIGTGGSASGSARLRTLIGVGQ